MESQNEALKVAIIGTGRVAEKAYLPLLRRWSGVQLVGICSRTQETVDRVCADWQIEFGTTDLNDLVALEPDAAFVLTPRGSHAALTSVLLKANIDVFTEKPPTESRADTRMLAQLAREHERILMFGFNRRYALLYRQAKSLFEGKRIQSCLVEKHRPSAFHSSLYNNYLEDTIHQIDLLRFFCGDITALHTAFEQEGDRLLGAISIARIPAGGLGTVFTSLQAGSWQEGVTLHGESLTVQVTAFQDLRIFHEDRLEVIGHDRPGRWIPDLVERGFQGAIAHFFDCIRSRRQPQTNGEEAVLTQELVEGLVACAGEPLQITPNPREVRT
jgi:virulence factor